LVAIRPYTPSPEKASLIEQRWRFHAPKDAVEASVSAFARDSGEVQPASECHDAAQHALQNHP
jgi:hypothetical protein